MMNPLSAGSLDANAKRKTTLFARRPEERTRPGPSFPCICLLLNIYTTLVKFVQPDRSWHFAHLAYEIWGGPNQQYPAVFVCVSYDFVASHCMYKCGLLPNNFVNEKLFVYTHLYILGYFSSVFDRNNGCSLYFFFCVCWFRLVGCAGIQVVQRSHIWCLREHETWDRYVVCWCTQTFVFYVCCDIVWEHVAIFLLLSIMRKIPRHFFLNSFLLIFHCCRHRHWSHSHAWVEKTDQSNSRICVGAKPFSILLSYKHRPKTVKITVVVVIDGQYESFSVALTSCDDFWKLSNGHRACYPTTFISRTDLAWLTIHICGCPTMSFATIIN